MKILIALDADPFKKGAIDLVLENLISHLSAEEHEVEILRVPLPRKGASEVIKHMLLFTFIELPNVDRVIALTFPASLLRHANKSVWLQRPIQSEEVFDETTTDAIRRGYQSLANEVEMVFTNSASSSEELKRFAGIQSIPLLPPDEVKIDSPNVKEYGIGSNIWNELIETLLK